MKSRIDPDTDFVLRRVAQSAAFGHSRAFKKRHNVEKYQVGTGFSTTICK